MKTNSKDYSHVSSVIGKYQGSQKSLEERSRIYKELLGSVPERITARFHVTGALDPKILDMQEDIRAHAMYPENLGVKMSQLVLFAILLMGSNEAAGVHARAARRTGASYEELQSIVSLVFLYRGLPAANKGAEILAELAQWEISESRGQ